MLQVTICKRWLLCYNHSPEWNNFGVGYCRCQCSWDGTWWPGDVGQPQCDYYLGWSQIRLLFCFLTKSCSSCQVVKVPTYRGLQMWPHCGVLSQHPLFDVALEGRSISALVFFPLQRHLLACNDHTCVKGQRQLSYVNKGIGWWIFDFPHWKWRYNAISCPW